MSLASLRIIEPASVISPTSIIRLDVSSHPDALITVTETVSPLPIRLVEYDAEAPLCLTIPATAKV